MSIYIAIDVRRLLDWGRIKRFACMNKVRGSIVVRCKVGMGEFKAVIVNANSDAIPCVLIPDLFHVSHHGDVPLGAIQRVIRYELRRIKCRDA